MVSKKVILQKEIEGLEDLVNKKAELVKEIEKLTSDIDILQKNMETFVNDHSNRMKNADMVYINMKTKITNERLRGLVLLID